MNKVLTLLDVRPGVPRSDGVVDDVAAQSFLQEFLQVSQLGETVHIKDVSHGGVGRHVLQLRFVGVFDSYSKNRDTGPTERNRRFAHTILGFSICDHYGDLLDVLPAALLLGEDCVQSEVLVLQPF